MTKEEVKTYADGYGVWWALVPTGERNKARAARTAINRELTIREGSGFAGVAVERVYESWSGLDSYVTYREVV